MDPELRAPSVQRAVAQRLLQHTLAQDPRLAAADLRLVRNSFGKPSLAEHPDVHVSVAHCAGAVLVAAADARIGVDVERIRPRDRFAVARMLHPSEIARLAEAEDPDREFFRYWTLKESYVKALGVGLSYPVRGLAVALAGDGTAGVDGSRAMLRLEEGFEGYVLAFCCLAGGPKDAEPAIDRVEMSGL